MLEADTVARGGRAPGRSAPADGVARVVGIGASAGGLDALQGLLQRFRPDGRSAYVVAQHMAQDAHHSLMLDLLRRAGPLPVRLLAQGDAPMPDTVSLIPAGQHAVLRQGRFELEPPSERFFSTPSIDALLQSLARERGASAVGVVLSGSGKDGAQGCRALHQVGALVVVQSPQEARFTGMPEAALAACPQARRLPLADIAAAWLPSAAPMVAPSLAPPEDAGDALASLLVRMRQTTGVDFSGYKTDTLTRRWRQRRQELQLDTPDAYLALVRQQPDELHILQQRFLVSVSSFVRNRAAFAALAQAWRGGRSAAQQRPFRCWVPACASGEEACSLVMLHEEGRRAGHWQGEIEVLGSDLNPQALAQAREGLYAPGALREVDADWRERYFSREGPRWRVADSVRARLRFERANVLDAVPPGPWDMVSCRNLLIYLKKPCQDRLLHAFHAALAPGGWLMVSPAESLSQDHLRLFTPHDIAHRIYRRQA